jgi:DDE family transposase
MASIPEVARAMEYVLTEVAEQAARATGFVQRRSKLTGAKFVQAVVLGWLREPAATLAQLAQSAASVGVAITPQGLEQRFTPQAAACLRTVLEVAVQQVVAAEPVALPLLQRFPAVTVQDSATIVLPPALASEWAGCGGRTGDGAAALKLQVRLDWCTGALTGPLLEAGRAADHQSPLQTVPLPPGALRLADLGYFCLDVLADLDAQGVYWLSRVQCQTAVFDARGRRRTLAPWLVALRTPIVEQAIQLGVRQRLPARLLAVRVPPAVAEARRRKLRAEARRMGRTVSKTRLALAAWTVLVTNAPAALLSVRDALVLMRVRWQIELLFKLWKQHGQIDESRSQQPGRILCELYAKLLAMVLQHWGFLLGVWACPSRSLVQAAQTVRAYAILWATAFAGHIPLPLALAQLQACLAVGCRINSRATAPNTYQLVHDPPELSLEFREVA